MKKEKKNGQKKKEVENATETSISQSRKSHLYLNKNPSRL